MKPKPKHPNSGRWIYDVGLWIVYGLTILFVLLIVYGIAATLMKRFGLL